MTPMMKAGYLAHARSAGFKARVERTKRIIADYPTYGVSVSWGKDSVVLLHLWLSVHGKAVAAHGRYGPQEELPDIPVVRDAFLSRFEGVTYKEVPVQGDWDVYEKAGRFFLYPESEREVALLKDWHTGLRSAMDETMIALGCDGKAIGLSAHESQGRKMNFFARGHHYHAKDERIPKLQPIAHWIAQDVLAYALLHGLPLLRAYTESPNPERARSEVAFAVIGGRQAEKIRSKGEWQEWARIYPDLWAVWVNRWPDILKMCA
jgi:3'-phosphoadenosine 5'-phosphosulfate sulfotransferase (PAPS reductase)/FAD synthetase